MLAIRSRSANKCDDEVYVELLAEAVKVWRLMEAGHLDDDRYRLIGDLWPFAVEDVVTCEAPRLEREPVLVAYETSD